jgi:hypothetical protein
VKANLAGRVKGIPPGSTPRRARRLAVSSKVSAASGSVWSLASVQKMPAQPSGRITEYRHHPACSHGRRCRSPRRRRTAPFPDFPSPVGLLNRCPLEWAVNSSYASRLHQPLNELWRQAAVCLGLASRATSGQRHRVQVLASDSEELGVSCSHLSPPYHARCWIMRFVPQVEDRPRFGVRDMLKIPVMSAVDNPLHLIPFLPFVVTVSALDYLSSTATTSKLIDLKDQAGLWCGKRRLRRQRAKKDLPGLVVQAKTGPAQILA